MRYEIREGGATRSVRVTRTSEASSRAEGPNFAVDTEDGQCEVVVLSKTAPFLVAVDGQIVEVRLAENRKLGRGAPGAFDVQLRDANAGTVELEVLSEQLLLGASDTASLADNSELKSPIPGRVLRVLIKSGDAVEKGQPVLVVEAMKMENELFAPCDGTVTNVRVQEGDAVEAQAPLLSVQANASGK